MNFIKHIFKQHKIPAVTILSLFLLIVLVKTFAAAPPGGYAPGATLDPDCAPGSTDCIVTSGGGTLSSILTSGNTTGGSNISVSDGDKIVSPGASFIDLYSVSSNDVVIAAGDISSADTAFIELIEGSGGSLTLNTGSGANSDQITMGNTIGIQSNGGNNVSIDTPGSSLLINASNGANVAIGISSPDASALLDLTSTTRGFLAPRMTTLERNAILSPAEGLSIYNTTTKSQDFYNGTSWVNAPYKKYVALISQTGTDAPTVDQVFENTLGITPVFSYSGVGSYVITGTGVFDVTKNWYVIQNNTYDNSLFQLQSDTSDIIYMYTQAGGVFANSVLSKTPIEIRIYP